MSKEEFLGILVNETLNFCLRVDGKHRSSKPSFMCVSCSHIEIFVLMEEILPPFGWEILNEVPGSFEEFHRPSPQGWRLFLLQRALLMAVFPGRLTS